MGSIKTVLPVLCLSIASICQAAEKPNVTALPISNRLIQGEMILANGELLKFKALEGTLVTVQGPEVGSFAISGEILNEASMQVRFTVFEIQDFGPGQQGLRQLEQFEVRDRASGSALQVDVPAITVDSIRTNANFSEQDIRDYRQAKILALTGAQDEAALAKASIPDELAGSCCVTCGSNTACGCSVSMSCGSCCSGSCCPGGSGKDPQNNY